MAISALGSVAAGATINKLAASSGSGFGAQLSVAVGQGRAGHGHGAKGHRTQETGTSADTAQQAGAVSAPMSATPAASLADTTRALVGDVFGALGANTPTAAAAQRAIEAYRQTT